MSDINNKKLNILPESGSVIDPDDEDERLKDIFASNSTLWLHFNGS